LIHRASGKSRWCGSTCKTEPDKYQRTHSQQNQ
jgi:hypothetical protein